MSILSRLLFHSENALEGGVGWVGSGQASFKLEDPPGGFRPRWGFRAGGLSMTSANRLNFFLGKCFLRDCGGGDCAGLAGWGRPPVKPDIEQIVQGPESKLTLTLFCFAPPPSQTLWQKFFLQSQIFDCSRNFCSRSKNFAPTQYFCLCPINFCPPPRIFFLFTRVFAYPMPLSMKNSTPKGKICRDKGQSFLTTWTTFWDKNKVFWEPRRANQFGTGGQICGGSVMAKVDQWKPLSQWADC